MIAPAMNTRPVERLFYMDLARQGAGVERRLAPQDLTRLSSIAHVKEPVDVALRFFLDEQGRVRITGTVDARVHLECQRCLENFDRSVHARLDLCVVADHQASAIGSDFDVFTADTRSVSCAELVEDELILALPERLCEEDPCAYAPQLYYPATESGEARSKGEDKVNPFSALAALKDQADS